MTRAKPKGIKSLNIYLQILCLLSICNVIPYFCNAQSSEQDDCHCNEVDCERHPSDGIWRCASWTCASGWYNAPYCDKACKPLTYGKNCENFCHCPVGDTCNSVSGECASGRCHEFYYSYACQIALPALHSSPEVTELNCNSVEVRWDRWNASSDHGAEDTKVHSYTVQYCEGLENGTCLTDYIPLPNVAGSAVVLIKQITGLKASVGYVFVVFTNRDDDGKKVVGRASDFKFHQTCMTTAAIPTTAIGTTTSSSTTSTTTSSTTPPTTSTSTTTTPTTTLPPVPLPLHKDNVTLQTVNSTSLTVSWQLPDVQPGLIVTGILINVTRVQHLACSTDPNSPYTVTGTVLASSVSTSFHSLSPYSEYECIIVLEYTWEIDRIIAYSVPYSGQFTTAPSAPSNKVEGLAGESIRERSFMATWFDYPCQWWNSQALTKLELELSRPGTDVVRKNYTVVGNSFLYDSLLPNVKYGLRIRPITQNYTGVWTSKIFVTTLNAVPPKARLEISSQTSDSIEIRIIQPDTTIAIEYYSVSYQKRKIVNCADESPDEVHSLGPFYLANSSSLTQTLSGLQPYTLYDIQITNVNSIGVANTSIQHATLGIAPQATVTVADSNSNPDQINFIWQRLDCHLLLGALQHYQVKLFEGDNPVDNSNTLDRNYTIESPRAKVVYRIRVRVVNNYGEGPWSPSYNTTLDIVRAPAAVTDLKLEGTTAASLTISWVLPSLDGNQGARYRLCYKVIEIGDCGPVTDSALVGPLELGGQPTEYVITGLEAWSMYEVTVDSVNDIGVDSNRSQFSTVEGKPSAMLSIHRVSEDSGTSVKLIWNRANCSILRGQFVEYQYRVSGIDDNSLFTGSTASIDNTSAVIPVTPNKRYEAKLRLQNSVGWGGYSQPYQFTSRNIAPMDISLIEEDVGETTLSVKWSRQLNDYADEVSYNISIARRRLADCEEVQAVYAPFIYLGSAVNRYEFVQLEPFSLYDVMLVAGNDVDSVETTESVTTLPRTPTRSVRNLRATDVSRTTLKFEWREIPCNEMTGNLLYYVIRLTNQSGGVEVEDNSTDRAWTAARLRPYSEYTISVSLQLENTGLSPVATISVSTLESDVTGGVLGTLNGSCVKPWQLIGLPVADHKGEVPSHVSQVLVEQIVSSLLKVSWTPPANNTGEVNYWMLTYTLDGLVNTVNVSASSSSYTIQDARPYTNYTNIMVSAVGSQGSAPPSPPVSFTTKPQVPSAPQVPTTTSLNMTCITLTWSQPAELNGVIKNYSVVYKLIAGPTGPTSSQPSTVIVIGPNEFSYTLCELNPASQYHFMIAASTDAGEGPVVTITGWSRIGTPPSPSLPEVQSVTESTITVRLYAVVSPLGPVTSYEIWVSESLTTARRKRNVAYQASSEQYAKLNPSDFNGGHYDFVVGDDRTTFGIYKNRPLKDGQKYEIYHVVISEQNGITADNYTVVEASTNATTASTTTATALGLSDGWVVAIAFIVAAVLGLIILILCCVFRLRHRSKGKAYVKELLKNESSCGYSPEPIPMAPTREQASAVYTGYWSPAFELGEDRYIVLENMEEDVYTDRQSVTFQQEFNNLPRGQQYPWSVASQHPKLNRVSHLVAYDHNRVKLSGSALGVDYINATHINGYANKCSYIATASPINEEGAMQFWQMIYEQNVTQIVMMTNMMDEGLVKCVQFWPEFIGSREVFGRITVELIEVQHFANFTIYQMRLSHDDGTSRDIIQYHYTNWPAHGVPQTTFPILDFRLAIRSHETSSPLVVHCGTGCSTTGFFIALDYLIAEAHASGNNVNVYRAVSHLRESRSFLVRTQKQYLLGGEKILSQGIKSKFKLLSKANPESGQRYFIEEMKRLNKFTPIPTRDELTAALLDSNRHKNRYPDDVTILPPDLYRVKLSLEHGTSDYINAVFIDGYYQRNAFILAQTPLHDTVVDFWRMVYEQGVSCIVMMDGVELTEESCAEYWPDSGHFGLSDSMRVQKSYGEFEVELYQTQQVDDICITREMIVTNKLQPSEPSRHVKQFQVLDWFLLNRPKPPKTGQHMLRLVDEVDEWKRCTVSIHNQSISSPTLVHCLNGATHSAVYPAVSLICEKMSAENHVNIFLTVKELKHRRKDALSSKHQYKYLHTVLRDYLHKDKYVSNDRGDYYQQQRDHRYRDEYDNIESYNDDDFSDEQVKMERMNSGDFDYGYN